MNIKDFKSALSQNDLIPSNNKSLPKPMLTKIYVGMWRHLATISTPFWIQTDDNDTFYYFVGTR